MAWVQSVHGPVRMIQLQAGIAGMSGKPWSQPGSLRGDLLQIAFLPRYPNDEELQIAGAVI
jgi:hypothetical protein